MSIYSPDTKKKIKKLADKWQMDADEVEEVLEPFADTLIEIFFNEKRHGNI